MNYPQPIKKRPLNNPRLGIKSSLPNPRKLIALLYLIYVNSNKKASVKYLVANPYDTSKATLSNDLAVDIANSIGKNEDYIDTLLSNPLVDSQIEALQVALQLFFRLAKINTTTPGQSERTGGVRYPKTLDFSTNMDIVDLFLSRFTEHQRNNFLISWLNEEDDYEVAPLMKRLLVTFVEPTIFRITESDNNILDFDLFGMYESFLKKGMNDIDYKGTVEAKGTSRVLGSYIKSGLHPFISQHGGSAEIDKDSLAEFREYAKRVDTALSIAPELDDYPFDSDVAESEPIQEMPKSDKALQEIYFGAPGTGKSFEINRECKGHPQFRTTFHPDTDYASFVGSYKPISEPYTRFDTAGNQHIEKRIVYTYVFQSFLKAYIKAWEEQQNENPEKVYLVIEEINRGNCAQIFGDIFQLLDRNEHGFSDYPIVADEDLKKELKSVLQNLNIFNPDKINNMYLNGQDVVSDVKKGEILLLPNNLYIRATMNTSDQSLFPIDSAFKRRWDWHYVNIKNHDDKNYQIVFTNGHKYDWWTFLSRINAEIEGGDINQEDKKLGYFFAKTQNGIISSNTFVSKVLFFLYNDVFKDFGLDLDFFLGEDGKPMTFASYFDHTGKIIESKVEKFLSNLGLHPDSDSLADENEDEDDDDLGLDESNSENGQTSNGRHKIRIGDTEKSLRRTFHEITRQALTAQNLTLAELTSIGDQSSFVPPQRSNLFLPVSEIDSWLKEHESDATAKDRFYLKEKDYLTDSNGEQFVANAQWSKTPQVVKALKNYASKLGISVDFGE